MRRKCCVFVRLKTDGEILGDAEGYMGSSVTVSENGIEIVGHDERGIAQAFYYLEDVMSNRRAPYIPSGNVKRKALFSPRMIHSGYGIDEFPDAHLAQIAHAGTDAILVFVKGVNKTILNFQARTIILQVKSVLQRIHLFQTEECVLVGGRVMICRSGLIWLRV